MKIKHNKKRNTAFVYEALIREATVAVLRNEHEKKDTVISIIRKHFQNGSALKTDLECYRSLSENQRLDQTTSEKILKEARLQKRLIDPEALFKQQTALIHDINKEISSSVFNNFVPSYKTLATIDQMFSTKISPKNQVILENEIITRMKGETQENTLKVPIDNVIYKTFVTKFNNKYDNELLEEQKNLLTYYIGSFSDNALALKSFLNEEIARLKTKLIEAKKVEEIKTDKEMLEKTEKIIDRLQSFAKEGVTENVLLTVLKTQTLVEEIYNGNHD
jgi:hypothetical protein|tara:strand:+ start:541 stop:1371 length:831 start_codon:yes stop_codon:yes gene_type:complete